MLRAWSTASRASAALFLALFADASPERRRRLEEVVAKIDDRFGGKQVRPAALLEEGDDEGEDR